MAAFITVSVALAMEADLIASGQPTKKTFGPFPDRESAEEALRKKTWKQHSASGWHAPYKETPERPYVTAQVVELSDITCNTEEFLAL